MGQDVDRETPQSKSNNIRVRQHETNKTSERKKEADREPKAEMREKIVLITLAVYSHDQEPFSLGRQH